VESSGSKGGEGQAAAGPAGPPSDSAGLSAGVAWNVASLAVLAVAGIGLNFLIGGPLRRRGPGRLQSSPGGLHPVLHGRRGRINYSLLRAVATAPRDPVHVAGAVVGALPPTVVLAALVSGLFYLGRHGVAELLDSPGVAVGMEAATPGLFCFAINKQLLAIVNGLSRMRAFAVYQALRYLLILLGFLLVWRLGWNSDQISFVWTFAEGLLLVVLSVEVGILVAWRRARGVLAWGREHLTLRRAQRPFGHAAGSSTPRSTSDARPVARRRQRRRLQPGRQPGRGLLPVGGRAAEQLQPAAGRPRRPGRRARNRGLRFPGASVDRALLRRRGP
jgi:hypothetical protein